jgi:hypothetical protein
MHDDGHRTNDHDTQRHRPRFASQHEKSPETKANVDAADGLPAVFDVRACDRKASDASIPGKVPTV